MIPSPSIILSIQSSVIAGLVGNTAAAPIYSLAGHQTFRIDSVNLAAHPGMAEVTKFIMPAVQMATLLNELCALQPMQKIKAIQTGYLGSVEQVSIISDFITKQACPLYVFDPVFGDNHKLYVAPELAAASARALLPLATITTPNAFELSYLSGQDVSCIDTAIKASRLIQDKGPKWVLATGIQITKNQVADMLSGPDTQICFRYEKQPTGISGAGDVLAALLTASLVSGGDIATAAKQASAITQALIRASSGKSLPLFTRAFIDQFTW